MSVQTLPEKVVQQIAISAAALEKAAAHQKAAAEIQTKVAALIPAVCDTMIKHERIRPDEREKLAARLQDPAGVLELLIKVSGHRNAGELAQLGKGVDVPGQTKQASANEGGMNQFVTGARRSELSNADRKLWQGFGLTPPG